MSIGSHGDIPGCFGFAVTPSQNALLVIHHALGVSGHTLLGGAGGRGAADGDEHIQFPSQKLM